MNSMANLGSSSRIVAHSKPLFAYNTAVLRAGSTVFNACQLHIWKGSNERTLQTCFCSDTGNFCQVGVSVR